MGQMLNADSPTSELGSEVHARKQSIVPDPKMAVGVALIVFGLWLALEGILLESVAQCFIAAIFLLSGWWFRKRGAADLDKVSLQRWVRFCTLAVPVSFVIYVLGYFVLKDRHTPTFPAASAVRFESTLRWAPYEWVTKAVPPYQTKWKTVNTWNILYRPMDRLWFRYFPRSQDEIETLREMGYYRN